VDRQTRLRSFRCAALVLTFTSGTAPVPARQ
jgi:hypothetical protein